MKILCCLQALAFFMLVVSCNKKSDPPSKTENISAAAWTYDNAGVDGDKNGTIDFALTASSIPACRIDNSLTFKRDNSGTTDEGATKCNAADLQVSAFAWGFADNETNINVSGNVFPLLNGKFKILALTATNFSLTRDTVISSQNVAVIVNLKH